MRNIKSLVVCMLCYFFSCSFLMAQSDQTPDSESLVIIHAGTLLAMPGMPPENNKTVLVKNGFIDRIADGFLSATELGLEPNTAKVVDLKDKFVLPGLIDGHVHIMWRYGSNFRDPAVSGEELLINGITNAKITLDAGFTTVADLDATANAWPAIVMRNAINAGEIVGPRLLTAGSSISPTGGHGDYQEGPDQFLEGLSSSGLCDGEAECRRAVRRQFRQGADLIKLHASGGGSERTGGKRHKPSFMEDEFRGIVETAHSLDLKVTAHAHGTAGIIAALKAGVDSIEHGSFLDKEAIRLFKKTGAYLLPTLNVQEMIIEQLKTAPPHAKPRLLEFMDEHPASVVKAWKAKVNLALGSDAGVVPHGSNVNELVWFVKVGISEAEAIKIGTINTATHLGLADKVGKLVTGMSADIIALTGNPLKDISLLRKIDFVMKEGTIFKHD
jgi:imidazolonepropionase-like amidohydrolase